MGACSAACGAMAQFCGGTRQVVSTISRSCREVVSHPHLLYTRYMLPCAFLFASIVLPSLMMASFGAVSESQLTQQMAVKGGHAVMLPRLTFEFDVVVQSRQHSRHVEGCCTLGNSRCCQPRSLEPTAQH